AKEKRLLALRKAVWAKPMRWFGAAFLFFKHVGDVVPCRALKLVFLLLGIPCLEISHFCFKRAYTIQLRRIRLASGDSIVQGIHDGLLHLDGFSSERLCVPQTY